MVTRERRKRSEQLTKILLIEVVVLCLVILAGILLLKSAGKPSEGESLQKPSGTTSLQGQPTGGTEPTEPSTEPTEPAKPDVPTPPEATWMVPETDRTITARTAFYYCVNRDELVIKNGEADAKIYPASVTKLLTVYVALQYVTPDEKVTVSNIRNMVSWDASVAGVWPGEVLTVEELVAGMLLPSGNDAAYVLAEAAAKKIANNSALSGQDALDVFMNKTNEVALSLGMTNTHFTNPCGFQSEDHYTTISDLVVLSKVVLKNDLIMKYAGEDKVSVTVNGRNIYWENTNRLLDPESEYYCPLTIGLKTGYTSAAGDCLLTAVEWDGFVWVVGTFGCPSKPERNTDTLQLINEALGIGAAG